MIRRSFLAFGLFVLLSACASNEQLSRNVEPIGDFRMGFNIVVANDVQQGPASRDATEEELADALRAATEDRLGRYDGDGLYHVGLRVEAYTLAQTGVPLLFSPRSVMLVAFNIWDDATQERLNPEPIRLTSFDGEEGPLIGSGLYRNREEQLAGLAFNAAEQAEKVLRQNADTWFAQKAGRERIEFTRDPATGRQLIVEEDADQTNLGAAATAAADAIDRGASAEEAAAAAERVFP